MSIEKTLSERGARYGDFADHARLCQSLKRVMQSFSIQQGVPGIITASVKPWEKLSPAQKQALEVIADKIARILSGDPNYADNWHDIQGYAKLVEDRLPKDADRHQMTPNVIEPADARMDIVARNGNDGLHYSELDRSQAAADFSDDAPIPTVEPKRPRHQCATCARGHATHQCTSGQGGER